jgi:hypothetical protein
MSLYKQLLKDAKCYEDSGYKDDAIDCYRKAIRQTKDYNVVAKCNEYLFNLTGDVEYIKNTINFYIKARDYVSHSRCLRILIGCGISKQQIADLYGDTISADVLLDWPIAIYSKYHMFISVNML